MDHTAKMHALQCNPVFVVLPDEALHALAKDVAVRKVARGQTVITEGEPGDVMYVVVEGSVKAYRNAGGGAIIELARCRPGDAFGELALLDGGVRSASIEATTRTTLLCIDRSMLFDLIKRYPHVVEPLLRSMGSMVRKTSERNADLAFLSLKARLARRLLELFKPGDDGQQTHLHQRVTNSELAQMVGATRQSINSTLHQMEDEGLIALSADGIQIIDEPALLRVISGES